MDKRQTLTAWQTAWSISQFVGQTYPIRGETYLDAVQDSFWGLSGNLTYKRASERLPKAVREMPVAGFQGYSLRIIKHTDSVLYLLSCHRPGLTEGMKNMQTRAGLKEI